MELDVSLPWLALALTPGLACRLCARLLRKIGSPERIFHASLTELESCSLPARVAQAIHSKEAFKRAEKELAGIRNIPGCRLLNWTEQEYPQKLLQIYDPPVLFYLRGDPQILNMPCLSIESTRRPTLLASAALGASERKLYELLVVEETRHIDELVENSGLNSSEVLPTFFDMEMKGVVRQLPGKQFSKVMCCSWI